MILPGKSLFYLSGIIFIKFFTFGKISPDPLLELIGTRSIVRPNNNISIVTFSYQVSALIFRQTSGAQFFLADNRYDFLSDTEIDIFNLKSNTMRYTNVILLKSLNDISIPD